MSKIFEVRSTARSNRKLHGWGARRSHPEAEKLLAATTIDRDWAQKYHDRWWIEEIDTTGLFQIPPAPPPRERFSTRATTVPSGKGLIDSLHVEVLDTNGRKVAEYDRNYASLFRTFEPFRQGNRLLALISSNYTATSVLDLESGAVIATEAPEDHGFCPVGYYVPDWWDIHDGSVLPGELQWSQDEEFPKGDFGFVWGSIWGDDSSWKVQYLDLSRVQQGELRREERFGYLKLAVDEDLPARNFIECSSYRGEQRVQFSVPVQFDLKSGKRFD